MRKCGGTGTCSARPTPIPPRPRAIETETGCHAGRMTRRLAGLARRPQKGAAAPATSKDYQLRLDFTGDPRLPFAHEQVDLAAYAEIPKIDAGLDRETSPGHHPAFVM